MQKENEKIYEEEIPDDLLYNINLMNDQTEKNQIVQSSNNSNTKKDPSQKKVELYNNLSINSNQNSIGNSNHSNFELNDKLGINKINSYNQKHYQNDQLGKKSETEDRKALRSKNKIYGDVLIPNQYKVYNNINLNLNINKKIYSKKYQKNDRNPDFEVLENLDESNKEIRQKGDRKQDISKINKDQYQKLETIDQVQSNNYNYFEVNEEAPNFSPNNNYQNKNKNIVNQGIKHKIKNKEIADSIEEINKILMELKKNQNEDHNTKSEMNKIQLKEDSLKENLESETFQEMNLQNQVPIISQPSTNIYDEAIKEKLAIFD